MDAATPHPTPSGAPDVSVVIPSRDRADLVRRAVRTALLQQSVSVEVIVVDDGSALPVSAVLQPQPNVVVLRNERSLGVSIARNQGVERARGRWIAFLDDDDIWAPNKLARQIAHMEEHGFRWSHTGALKLTGEFDVIHATPLGPASTSTSAMIRSLNQVSTPSCVVVEAELARSAGGFDSTLSIMADWDLWIRLSSLAPAAYLPEHLIGYVTHDRSMHRVHAPGMFSEYRRLRVKHRPEGTVGGPIVWRWIAQTHRRTGRPGLAAVAITAAFVLDLGGFWRHRDEFRKRLPPLMRRFARRTPPLPLTPHWAAEQRVDAGALDGSSERGFADESSRA